MALVRHLGRGRAEPLGVAAMRAGGAAEGVVRPDTVDFYVALHLRQ